jgi:hypothetical protein
MKALLASLLLILVGPALANSDISAANPLGLKTINNPMPAVAVLDQPSAFRPVLASPPRGLCAKADYYCTRGYQNWCDVWTLNRCDEL